MRSQKLRNVTGYQTCQNPTLTLDADALNLGNQNALSAASGVFLLRLDRAP
jgi:hypothetical protein